MQLSAIPLNLPHGRSSESTRERVRRFAASTLAAITALCAILMVSLATVLLELA
jgi:hypothetical protein